MTVVGDGARKCRVSFLNPTRLKEGFANLREAMELF